MGRAAGRELGINTATAVCGSAIGNIGSASSAKYITCDVSCKFQAASSRH
jgi:hypothetical protein